MQSGAIFERFFFLHTLSLHSDVFIFVACQADLTQQCLIIAKSQIGDFLDIFIVLYGKKH